jgi:membrane-bound lytic murein transglycosylase B
MAPRPRDRSAGARLQLHRGHIDAPSMLGSWAGAMGQPRRFLVHANYDALLHYNCAHHYAQGSGFWRSGSGAEAS